MTVLIALLVALIFGFAAYLVCSVVPFTKPYASAIGVFVTLVVFITRIGAGL